MRIAIIGAGAIGSLFACGLYESGKNDVLCVTRSEEKAEAIRNKGITIRYLNDKKEKSFKLEATSDTSVSEPADIVFLMVKVPDSEAAVIRHKKLFSKNTIAVTLQNGYGNEEIIKRVLPAENIVIGTTAMGAYIDGEGSIVHAGDGETVIGPVATGGKEVVSKVAEILERSGFKLRLTDDVTDAVLRKLFINIGINAICALNGIKNGDLLKDAELMKQSRELVCEAIDVVALSGRKYDKDIILEAIENVIRATAENKCSMLQDVEKGKATEIDRINGAIVEMAEKAGVIADKNKEMVKKIKSL